MRADETVLPFIFNATDADASGQSRASFWRTSYVALFEAYYRGRVTVVAPLVAVESLAGVALSVLFLRESEVVGKRLALGAALIVAGGALIGAFR